MSPGETVRGVLGVVLAGGDNRRFGTHKALAGLGSRRIVDYVIDAVSAAVGEVVVVANELELYGSLGLEVRPDLVRDIGSLGGIITGVSWAAERGCRAALVVACDMPLLTPTLLRELAGRAEADAAWLPASTGPRGFEPLCAAYGVGCLSFFQQTVKRGERAVVSALAQVKACVVPLEAVQAFGDPDLLFLNINRPADRERAEALLALRSSDGVLAD